jgi:exosortase
VAVAVAASYHEVLAWMGQQWWKDEYYGHGMLIPVVSGYLLWHERDRLSALPRRGDWRGLLIVVAALLLQGAAQALGVHFAAGFALVATLWGLSLWLWGPAVARAVLFPLAFLLFMVPLSRILVEKLSLPMQLLSARGAGAVASMVIAGVKVAGTSIATPAYTFTVAIPCSGLKSLISMSALGALFAFLVEGPPIRRVVLFLAALPIAVLANLTRIFATVILGDTIGPAAAEGFFHTLSGVFVFLLALGGLFALGGALGCQKMRDDI